MTLMPERTSSIGLSFLWKNIQTNIFKVGYIFFLTMVNGDGGGAQWAEMTFFMQFYNNYCKINIIYKNFLLGASNWLHFCKH